MRRYSYVIFIIAYFAIVNSNCPQPTKFYIDCIGTHTLSSAIQRCRQYGMTLLNLTNSSSLTMDIINLNQTLFSNSCSINFWFASGNSTGYVASTSSLGAILTGLLTGTLNLVLGLVGDLLSCLLLFCPITTTTAPITQAVIVCTRPLQQRVIQKCPIPSGRMDMKIFKFSEGPMYGGVLDSFASQSLTECSIQCSSNAGCIGVSYINEICNFYI